MLLLDQYENDLLTWETKGTKTRKIMSLNMKEYEIMKDVYSKNKESFQRRIENTNLDAFTNTNWSDAFLDFYPFEAIFRGFKPKKISKQEKDIENYFINNQLLYSVKKKNYKWGSAFIDYYGDHNIWLLFVESYHDHMNLDQVKINFFNENKQITKTLTYVFREKTSTETFMIYSYEYDNNLISVTREGFYNKIDAILPTLKFTFEYDDKKMKITAHQSKFVGDTLPTTTVMYNGKIIKPLV